MPYFTLGLPVRLTSQFTNRPARTIAANTHHPLIPAVTNRPAARGEPASDCTSLVHTLKISKAVHRRFSRGNGARSSL